MGHAPTDVYLTTCDRKNDMIISGGMNVYPAEVEAAIERHPDVADIAVFGIPSEDWGESVHAVIVPRAGATLTADAVTASARSHLAGYKVPRSIAFADELPRTGSGKLLKRVLREPFWRGQTRRVGRPRIRRESRCSSSGSRRRQPSAWFRPACRRRPHDARDAVHVTDVERLSRARC